MRRFLLLAALALLAPWARAVDIYGCYNGSAQQGGQKVSTNGINSKQYVQQSYPITTVTVFDHGTSNKSTIFTDATGAIPLANPFQSSSTGTAFWCAADGHYDVQYSGTTIASPFTVPNVGVFFSGGGGGGGNVGPGTSNRLSKFSGSTNVGNSVCTDDGITPVACSSGLNVTSTALFATKPNNASTGTTVNLLVARDSSGNAIQAQPTDTNNLIGIAGFGAGTTGNVTFAYSGNFPCQFDNQTAINDWAILGSASQCHDAGATEPAGVQNMGRITSINSGTGTLANIDMGLPDVNPAVNGGVGNCGSAAGPLAFYTLATNTGCDASLTTDGSGNLSGVSGTFSGSGSGFVAFGQGVVPTLTSPNSAYLYAPATVATSFGTALPPAPGTLGQVLAITNVVDGTHVQTGWETSAAAGLGYPVIQYGWVCDGNTDDTAAALSLLGIIGSTPARLIFSSGQCLLDNIVFPANVTLDFSSGGSIKARTSTTTPGNAVFVQGAGTEAGATTTCSVTLSSTNAGDTIVFLASPYPGFTYSFTKVTDTQGGLYFHVQQSPLGLPRNQGAWVVSNIAGGNVTITATANGTLTTSQCMAQEYSGLGPIVNTDGLGSSSETSGTTMTSGSTSTTAGSLLIGYGGQPFTAETCSAGAGYIQPAATAGETSPNGYLCSEYKLSSAGGATTATQSITADPSPGTWVYSLLALKPGSATITILGGIVDPDQHQIFYNSVGSAGLIDFTGSTTAEPLVPEWWGASPQATAAVNTPALQAWEHGMFGSNRNNSSGLSQYNREGYLNGNYQINGELKFYSVNGFKITCNQRLNGGITQTQTNLRIIDGQSISYGSFNHCSWASSASNTNALIDLDYNGVDTAGDLRPQFIDFYSNNFVGNGQTDVGVLIAKSGGGAQGSNIYCYDCESNGFTGAAWQVGGNNTGRNAGRFYAQNALDIGYTGDIQGSPLYGIAVYGGGYIGFGSASAQSSMENGFATQTGFDMYCEATQGPCTMEHVRSESRRLIAGSTLWVKDSRTVNQAAFPTPGSTWPVFPTSPVSIITGSAVGGDGKYYKVTVSSSALGGFGTPSSTTIASSGSGTTLVDTNQTIAGSLTIGTMVAAETVTQASTGSTGTVVVVPASTGTITGSVTTGTIGSGHVMTQATTGVTCTSTNAPTGIQSLACKNFSGTADSSHIWTDGATSGTYTPTAAPTFSATSMIISAATGSPDNSHNWVGGTSSAVFVPTTSPTGIGWTVNAFVGFRASVMSGTNVGCYGVITANTATAITVAAGWITNYQFVPCPGPDSTSTFIVEPDWGTQFTSGGTTWVDLNENGIEGNLGSGLSGAILEDVDVPGDRINIASAVGPVIFSNVTTTRNDWANLSSGNAYNSASTILNRLDVHNRITVVQGAQVRYQSYSLPRINHSNTFYSGTSPDWLGTQTFIWSCGQASAIACNDVWIGGRSDPAAQNSVSRNILEFGGILGRATPFGTDQNGTDTDIQGGLPTGAGTPGKINFWIGNAGSTGSTIIDGTKVGYMDGAGLHMPVSFTQSGTGAVARTTKLQDVVSVKDFGAAGTGGDDTPFFTLALAAARAVYVPCGTYNVTGLAWTSGHTLFGPQRQMDFNAGESCVIIQSSSGDINIAGSTTLADVFIAGITFKSNAGGGHAFNFNAATTQIAQIHFDHVNCFQQNLAKACVLYDVAAGAAYEVYFTAPFLDAEEASRTVPMVKFRALTVNTISMTDSIVTSHNSADGTYQVWLEATNSGAPAFGNSFVGYTSEVPGGGGINCLGCVVSEFKRVIDYDLSVVPANPLINIATSPAGTLSLNNKIELSYGHFGSAAFPDVNIQDTGGTQLIESSNFGFVSTSNFLRIESSTIGALSPSYAFFKVNSTGFSGGVSGSIGGAAGTGQYIIAGATSGSVTQTANDIAGTPTITWGTTSGVPAVGLRQVFSPAAPTISSGFGSFPSVTAHNGTAAFRINVGTGGSATSGIIAMNFTAATGWNCSVNDLTAAAAHVAYNTVQTASAATTVTVENQTKSTGAAVAWAASDILALTCVAF